MSRLRVRVREHARIDLSPHSLFGSAAHPGGAGVIVTANASRRGK